MNNLRYANRTHRNVYALHTIFIAAVLLVTSIAIQQPATAAPLTSPFYNGQFVLLATGVKNSYDKIELLAADSDTLQPFDGLPSIPLRHHFEYALTPNRQTLAAITWPSGNSDRGGELHMIDIPSWTDRPTGLQFDTWVQNLTFDAGGKSLYWMAPATKGSEQSLPRDFKLFRYDVASGNVTELATLPKMYMPMDRQMRLLPTLNRMAIYVLPIDEQYLTQEHPHLVMVDVKNGGIMADLTLTSLVDGSYKVKGDGASDSGYGYDNAAITWNLDKNLMYIVHPTLPRTVIIDLAKLNITLWNLPTDSTKAAGPAKMNPGVDRSAALSSAGDRLYMSGLRRTVTKRDDGRFDMENLPMGIVALDVITQTPVYKGDFPVSRLALSPDGKLLLAAGDTYTLKAGKDKTVSSGLYILNAADGSVVKHFTDFEDNITFDGFSPDGRTAYVSAWLNTGQSSMTLRAIDLQTLTIVERKIDSQYLSLVGTRRD